MRGMQVHHVVRENVPLWGMTHPAIGLVRPGVWVLVIGQTNAAENGRWIVLPTAWHRTVADACAAVLALNRKPTVPDVIPLVRAYRVLPGNEAGGSLHILLEDSNVTDKDVQFCLENAERLGDADGAALARVLLKCSKTQRLKMS